MASTHLCNVNFIVHIKRIAQYSTVLQLQYVTTEKGENNEQRGTPKKVENF